MAQGARPDRVGEEIREELATLLVRSVHDPGIGFVTLTRVKMSPDLQLARVYYTIIGDVRARKETQKALERATPFLRRQVGSRVRLRRVPEIRFEFDQSVEHQDRVEQILMALAEERKTRPVQMDSGEVETESGAASVADADGPSSDAGRTDAQTGTAGKDEA